MTLFDYPWKEGGKGLTLEDILLAPVSRLRTQAAYSSLDAYEPDILVLLHWTDEMSPFEGLKLNRIPFDCGSVALFSIEGYKTKVLWSYHPRALYTFGNSEKAIAEILARSLDKLK